MSTTILVVDDHAAFRTKLRTLLDGEPGFDVVGEATDGRTAVELATQLTPNVILMDIVLPDINGIDATRQITANSPGCRVLGLSMHSDKRLMSEALAAGARGFVTKDSAAAELASAIHAVAGGATYISSDLRD